MASHGHFFILHKFLRKKEKDTLLHTSLLFYKHRLRKERNHEETALIHAHFWDEIVV